MEGFKSGEYGEYDEAFVMRAVALSYSKTWSNPAIAAALCIPEELFAEWIRDYADLVCVRYLDDKYIKGQGPKAGDEEKLERCPGCGSDVLFEPVKTFEVRREEGVDIGTHDSIMDSGDDGIFGAKIPYKKITIEVIARCPGCGIYTIQNVTKKMTNSEA